MARDVNDMTPVEGRDALVAYLEEGCKPLGQFRIGTEHEKFVFQLEDLKAPPYEGERGIRALLEGMVRAHPNEPDRVVLTRAGRLMANDIAARLL